MSMDLLSQHCTPLPSGTPTLSGEALDDYLDAVSDRWKVVDDHHLEGEFEFEDFVQALEFTNQVGEVAEEQEHHPEITLTWGKVTVKVWTHSIDGLSPNDFILAAHVDQLA